MGGKVVIRWSTSKWASECCRLDRDGDLTWPTNWILVPCFALGPERHPLERIVQRLWKLWKQTVLRWIFEKLDAFCTSRFKMKPGDFIFDCFKERVVRSRWSGRERLSSATGDGDSTQQHFSGWQPARRVACGLARGATSYLTTAW